MELKQWSDFPQGKHERYSLLSLLLAYTLYRISLSNKKTFYLLLIPDFFFLKVESDS